MGVVEAMEAQHMQASEASRANVSNLNEPRLHHGSRSKKTHDKHDAANKELHTSKQKGR